MVDEMQVVHVYADEKTIKEKINLFEAFGWQMTEKQKCQIVKKRSRGRKIILTNDSPPFVELTFSRGTTAPWYKEVAQKEVGFYRLCDEEEAIYRKKPKEPRISYVALLLFCCLFIIPGVIYVLIRKTSRKYTNDFSAWEAKYKVRLEEIEKMKSDILRECDGLINITIY